MTETFTIPVNFQGEELELKARFERWGYTHRIAVLIGETTVNFEPDEEGGYRALVNPESDLAKSIPEKELLCVIAETLSGLSK